MLPTERPIILLSQEIPFYELGVEIGRLEWYIMPRPGGLGNEAKDMIGATKLDFKSDGGRFGAPLLKRRSIPV